MTSCMTVAERLLKDIEAFLEAHDMSATTFGLRAVGDKAFVFRLRKKNRGVRSDTMDRVMSFIDRQKADGKRRPRSRLLGEGVRL